MDDLKFIKASKTLNNPYIEDWKKENKKVLGYFCSFMPEEILHSMDILPFRIRGTGAKDTAYADSALSHFNCSYVRCAFNLAMEGKYDFLDGMVFSNSCDHTRRLYDVWQIKLPREGFPFFYLSLPHIITEAGQVWLKKEYDLFNEGLEKAFNVPLNETKLKNSINVYNKNRELLNEIQELRSLSEPKLNGSDFSKIMVANTSIPKETCNFELQKIITTLKEKEGIKDIKARFMLVGSYVDNPEFYRIFQDVGGIVVTDSLCYGVRNFLNNVESTSSSSPLTDVVNRYYYKISCPRMMGKHQERLEFIKDQVKKAKVDGVIVQRLEFCDLHGCDCMLFEHELEELNIPVLNIDREYLLSDVARFKTRVEAFIEQILIN